MSPTQDELFRTFHRHRRLVRRELANPLRCSCNGEQVTVVNENDELMLRCLYCGIETVPGIKTIKNVEAIVKEHFVDD